MCGVTGVTGTDQAAALAWQALLMLQHRGQDGAGLLVSDVQSGQVDLHREVGLIKEAIPASVVERMYGETAIAHNRYATVASKKSSSKVDLQPQFITFPDGLSLAHNGNIVNAQTLASKLKNVYRRNLMSQNDVEIMLNLLSIGLAESDHEASPFNRLSQAVSKVMQEAKGAYAAVGHWSGHGLFAFRDPHGIRPLILGRKGESWMVASESNALEFVGFEVVGEVKPGELVFIAAGKTPERRVLMEKKMARCFFEWVYFSTAEAEVDGESIYATRLELGKNLAAQIKPFLAQHQIDLVVPVPDTGRAAAVTLAEDLHLPLRDCLVKNRYVHRSFILPTKAEREKTLKHKLAVVKNEVRGKAVLLVDDSIVRGATSRQLISLMKEAGAKKVFLASTSPAIRHPCFFGIDFPQSAELVAYNRSDEAVAEALGADGVFYLSPERLRSVLTPPGLCMGCVSGEYPFDVTQDSQDFQKIRANEGVEKKKAQL